MESHPDLRRRLLELRRRDGAKRQELIDRDELSLGYHPEMEEVHDANARAFEEILRVHGWPTASQVGADAAQAAWMIAAHAIGRPTFQRRCLDLLAEAVGRGGAPAAHWAALTDRIRFNERRPQVYGTLLDWDEDGRLSPWPIEEAEGVAERRRAVGLPVLEESLRQARQRARLEGARAPKPFDERQVEIEQWARRVGWIQE